MKVNIYQFVLIDDNTVFLSNLMTRTMKPQEITDEMLSTYWVNTTSLELEDEDLNNIPFLFDDAEKDKSLATDVFFNLCDIVEVDGRWFIYYGLNAWIPILESLETLETE